jgi:thiamine-phosphate pyrophosphorylase
MKSLSQCRLYTFVDVAYLNGRSPVGIARELCEGGSDLIQLRAKNLSASEIRRVAEQILPVTDGAGVGLVINDYPEIALEVGAALCHLGQEDFFSGGRTHVSQLVPFESQLKVGLSSHAPAEAEKARLAGASYIAIGPVYATATKPAATPVTLEYVRWAVAHLHLPWFAIGGINLDNIEDVLSAGARGICVVSAILNAPDVARACQAFKKRLSSVAIEREN